MTKKFMKPVNEKGFESKLREERLGLLHKLDLIDALLGIRNHNCSYIKVKKIPLLWKCPDCDSKVLSM